MVLEFLVAEPADSLHEALCLDPRGGDREPGESQGAVFSLPASWVTL